jgi:hypothetical protein
MKKISDLTAATTMNNADLLEKSETNSPSPGFTSKKITWANFVAAITALLSYVIDDGGVSVVGNLPIYNDTDGLHIIDSGIPKPGIHKAVISGGSDVFAMAADSMIKEISILYVGAGLNVTIGTTLGGNEILDTTTVDQDMVLTNVNKYFAASGIIYVTSVNTGASVFKLRIDYLNKYYII